MNFLKIVGECAIGLLVLAILALAGLVIVRDDFSQFESYLEQSNPSNPTDKGVTVAFLGNSNLLIEDGATSLLIDGWFTRPTATQVLFTNIEPDTAAIADSLQRAGIEQLAAVIPVHSHFDHAMDVAEVAQLTGALVLGSESTANIARGGGLVESQIRVAEPNSTHSFGAFRITIIPSEHYVFPSARMREAALTDTEISAPLVPPVAALDYKMGGAYSIYIDHPKGRLLVQGSAGFKPGALASYNADVVFLGVGGIAGQTAAYQESYWQAVVQTTQPKLIYPIHYDSLTDNLSDRPIMPSLLVSWGLKARAADGIQYALERAHQNDMRAKLLPMWQPVVLFK